MNLVCPDCKLGDSLATTERLYGAALCDTITSKGPSHTGTTEYYEAMTTVGVECISCGWSYRGDDWLSKLVPEPEEGE